MTDQRGEHPVSGQWPGSATQPGQARALRPVFAEILQQEHLADGLLDLFEPLYLPMADWLAQQHRGEPLMVGLHGGQGSGKSTLSKMLKALLESGYDKRVVVISIDDLYLPRAARQRLAEQVHPLLATRGVPGTHDLPLAMDIMQRLKQGRDFPLSIPLFDKAVDDRAPLSRWQTLEQPADIILFEGWCVGAAAQSEAQLVEPINSLERDEDPQQVWRRYVNEQLAGPYQALFAMIDVLMMLKVPAMEKVFEWRLLQETKLKQSLADNAQTGTHVMSEQQLNRFIMHYERITRTCLEDMPGRADVVLQLNDQHQISEVQLNGD